MKPIASLLRKHQGANEALLVSRAKTADYFILLSRALEGLPDQSPERRAELYESARTALAVRLKAANPPISRAQIKAEQRALDDAVEAIEARPVKTGAAQVEQGTDQPETPAPVAFPDIEPDRSVSSRDDARSISRSEKQEMTTRQFQSTFSQRIVEEKPMSRLDEINRALRKLQSDSFGVEACALISEDGLMIASVLAADMEEARVAGMTATILSLGTRAATELGRSHLQEVIIRGESGYAVLVGAGRGALLLALTNANSKLGLIFFDMREAVRSLQKVL
ncbi:MAG TPA: roadblock/LC7 domain-containing protein [Bradyrhizobium sp.]|nr:roadblock/LC7 domain-containing protein [Bradyrhizobium sp.]